MTTHVTKADEDLLEKLENETFEEEDSNEVPPNDIVAYNELRSCADLFRMHTQGILDIQPEFQREVVWKSPDQTRFIDSLMKQLPVPSMCFSFDYKTKKWMVIDGLQRMSSIIKFLSGGDSWKLSKLEDIDPKISGEPVSKFIDKNSDLHHYYSQVENLTLPITVIRCDYSKRSHTNYLFTIFHRLNTGGMKLNNQEIRNCIYNGTLNSLLKSLDENMTWKRINRVKSEAKHRFTKQELILRLFAFHDQYNSYGGRLARFLNLYMNTNQNPGETFLSEKREMFERTIDVLFKKVFEGKVPKISTTILESVLVGISFNLPFLEAQTNAVVKGLYNKLLDREELSEQKLIEGLSGKPRVIERISAAREVFSGI